jgi:hypothetical protein
MFDQNNILQYYLSKVNAWFTNHTVLNSRPEKIVHRVDQSKPDIKRQPECGSETIVSLVPCRQVSAGILEQSMGAAGTEYEQCVVPAR